MTWGGMMHYWNTGDPVTDRYLQILENFSGDQREITPDQMHDFACLLISIEKMMPKAVWRHFSIPDPYIADGAYRWSGEFRNQKAAEFRAALREGLERAKADATLTSGKCDLTDRPRSKGEEIIFAAKKFREQMREENLRTLERLVFQTRLSTQVKQIRRAFDSRRPRRGYSDATSEILSELRRIEFDAESYFREPA